MLQHLSVLIATIAWSVLTSAAAAADCNSSNKTDDVRRCLEKELRQSDSEINQLYQGLRKKLNKTEQIKLRDEQRLWIKNRDRTCNLESKEANREKWLQELAQNPAQTLCVTRFTRTRIAELKDALQANAAKPRTGNPQDDQTDSDRFRIVVRQPLTKGKWYFEVNTNTSRIIEAGYNTIVFGFACGKSPSTGSETIDIDHPATIVYGGMATYDPENWIGIFGEGKFTHRFAIDLDNGQAYIGDQSTWHQQPGSAQGAIVKLNTACVAMVQSTLPIKLLGDGLSINTGESPFVHEVPQGFQAVYKNIR